MSAKAAYREDFYAWTRDQARRLRRLATERSNVDLDLENLAEEIESVGKSDRRAVESHLTVVLLHMLKWAWQPSRRGPSWSVSIDNARDELDRLLADSPSLRSELPDMVARNYPRAARKACRETGLPPTAFPTEAPWTIARILDPDFLPDD